MVREIVTVDWCDLCMRDDRRERVAESHRLVIDGKAYNVDLCADHLGEFKAFVDLVAVASAAHTEASGSVVGPSKESHHDRHCLLCSFVARTPSPLVSHVQDHHGLANPGAMFGLACPLCPYEGGNPQALGIHCRSHRAEYPSVGDTPTAFVQAEVLGDPLGVVARARAAAERASAAALAKAGRKGA